MNRYQVRRHREFNQWLVVDTVCLNDELATSYSKDVATRIAETLNADEATGEIEARLTAINERDNDQARGSGVIASAFRQVRDVECERDMLRARNARLQARLDEASDILAAVQDHCQNCPDWDLDELVSEWQRDGVFPVGDPADDVSNDPESAR